MLFFWNFLLRVGWERNGTVIFIFSICQPIPTYFGLKRSHNRIFLIFWKFSLFFWNFLWHVGWERNGTTIFIFSISRPFPTYFDLKWSPNGIIWFFYFSSFLFLEFFITRRVWTEQKGNFYFFSFSAFSNLFWHEIMP